MAAEIAERELGTVNEDSVIANIGVDSLAMLELVGEMERRFKVQIPDDQLVGIETVSQLLDLVEQRSQMALSLGASPLDRVPLNPSAFDAE
ncbi:MAG: acyl carrier protein [Myxococcota bacterium]